MSIENLTARWLAEPKDPEKVVIYSEQGNLTYLSLQQQVCQLAGAFETMKLLENERVIIAMDDSSALYISFLASVACGAIPIVVNPKLSKENLTFIINDSQASLLISKQDDVIQFHFYHNMKLSKTISLDDLLSFGVLNWNNYHYKQEDDIAFMQYTSGTTGSPKGVMHSSKNALSSVRFFAKDVLHANSADRFYSLAKSFFGYGLGNSLFFPLECGASVVLDADWPSPNRVLENLLRYRPSVFFGVPAMYQALLSNKSTKEAFASVRATVSAGASLPEKLFTSWEAEFNTPILDGLGSTELCHIFCSQKSDSAQAGSLGKALQEYDIEIRDQQGNVVPNDVCGNMWVKGPSLSLGYWQNPSATEIKFQSGWYNTGDLATRDKRGCIYFKGRSDDLFKVNGRWVIPCDIEKGLLSEFSSVIELAIVPVLDENGLTKAALFIVTNDNNVSSLLSDINNWCQMNLSNYQRPLHIKVLSTLPRNDNGKVIRKLLSLELDGVV
ncbi:AMP-binding protein [Pseudoalteromonas rhizosphaerae]|uniref:AMP-binding protein n=1 Tax=Pseudoalteromonas rhizosphaerae TaxID=2518973 RepID=A0ABW8L1P7_9GAMM